MQVSLNEKDLEVIWLNMRLADEKQNTSRVSMNRDISRATLHKDPSRGSFYDYNVKNNDAKVETLKKDKEKLEKRIKELEIDKIRVSFYYITKLQIFISKLIRI